ncbi:hypothetical protein [Verrucosispora sp. TAA-831]|uniref:hypothetical protein n=1 Tax=Verrucosispora sp. TAA-831 TaxID=3422227 RepID=UPI003D6E1700
MLAVLGWAWRTAGRILRWGWVWTLRPVFRAGLWVWTHLLLPVCRAVGAVWQATVGWLCRALLEPIGHATRDVLVGLGLRRRPGRRTGNAA